MNLIFCMQLDIHRSNQPSVELTISRTSHPKEPTINKSNHLQKQPSIKLNQPNNHHSFFLFLSVCLSTCLFLCVCKFFCLFPTIHRIKHPQKQPAAKLNQPTIIFSFPLSVCLPVSMSVSLCTIHRSNHLQKQSLRATKY